MRVSVFQVRFRRPEPEGDRIPRAAARVRACAAGRLPVLDRLDHALGGHGQQIRRHGRAHVEKNGTATDGHRRRGEGYQYV